MQISAMYLPSVSTRNTAATCSKNMMPRLLLPPSETLTDALFQRERIRASSALLSFPTAAFYLPSDALLFCDKVHFKVQIKYQVLTFKFMALSWRLGLITTLRAPNLTMFAGCT